MFQQIISRIATQRMITSFIMHYPDEEAPPREDETVADGRARGRQSKARPAIALVNNSRLGSIYPRGSRSLRVATPRIEAPITSEAFEKPLNLTLTEGRWSNDAASPPKQQCRGQLKNQTAMEELAETLSPRPTHLVLQACHDGHWRSTGRLPSQDLIRPS